MQQQYINSFDHPLYQKFINLYKVSFPIFEQRTEKQQDKAFKNNKYKFSNDRFGIKQTLRINKMGSKLYLTFLCLHHSNKTSTFDINGCF